LYNKSTFVFNFDQSTFIMSRVGINAKRFIVFAIAVILAIFAIIDLATKSLNWARIALQVAILVCAVAGIIGVWRMDRRWLGFFLVLMVVLFCLQIAYIIERAVNNVGAREFVYNIVIAAILLVGTIFTAELRRVANSHHIAKHGGHHAAHTSGPVI
jgi:hypothetical protein